MITLLLAAGEGQRFRDAGYATPKPLLPMPDDRPMLAWLLEALVPTRLVFVGREVDREALHPVLLKYLAGGSNLPGLPKRLHTIWTTQTPSGPLASALEACNALGGHSELVVSYCDVIPRPGIGPFLVSCQHSGASAGALCFESNDPRFGRTPSGKHAVSGLFWFRDVSEFIARARGFPLTDEIGIPHIVWASAHIEVVWPESDILDLGTPEAYETFLKENSQ
jgi:hypothetical protein